MHIYERLDPALRMYKQDFHGKTGVKFSALDIFGHHPCFIKGNSYGGGIFDEPRNFIERKPMLVTGNLTHAGKYSR